MSQRLQLTIGVVSFADQAKAGSISLRFDNGRSSLGGVLQDKVTLPTDANFTSPDCRPPGK
ncbi:MAG: hypothetical protein ACSLFI_05065 [Solirubrobacterales bacterium]